jgi:large subunit ribosomal protein L1
VEFRNDRTGNVHVTAGKKSFTPEQIQANVLAIVDAISRAKPSGVKGVYCRTLTVATSMGPAIALDVSDTLAKASQVSQ